MEQEYKITKKSAADLVSDKMKELLANKTWDVGQKIPTEMELSRNFGVNRLTVRIALQRLNAMGLLDIRVGDGTYVKRFDLNEHIHELAEFYINQETLENVTEYRTIMELGCLPTIITHYTDEELAHFHELCLQFRDHLAQYYLESDTEQAQKYFLQTVDISEELHATLVGMTHNDLMIYAFTLAKEPMRRHMYYNASNRLLDLDADQQNIWSKHWLAFYDALAKKEEEACRKLLQKIIVL